MFNKRIQPVSKNSPANHILFDFLTGCNYLFRKSCSKVILVLACVIYGYKIGSFSKEKKNNLNWPDYLGTFFPG